MATEFDTGLPSARQVQMMIRDRQPVEIKLMTGDTLTGQVQWQDHHALGVNALGDNAVGDNALGDNGSGQNTILMRGAIAYIKVAG